MKILLLAILFIPIFSFGQNKTSKFVSYHQIDKTYDGNKKSGSHKATIIFSDPKSITKVGTPFEKLPTGYMVFKFEGLEQVKENIFYIKSIDNQDIYGILDSETGNDIIYVIKYNHKVGNKFYAYSIVLGKSDNDDLGAPLQYYTAFHCNLAK